MREQDAADVLIAWPLLTIEVWVVSNESKSHGSQSSVVVVDLNPVGVESFRATGRRQSTPIKAAPACNGDARYWLFI